MLAVRVVRAAGTGARVQGSGETLKRLVENNLAGKESKAWKTRFWATPASLLRTKAPKTTGPPSLHRRFLLVALGRSRVSGPNADSLCQIRLTAIIHGQVSLASCVMKAMAGLDLRKLH